MTICPHCHQTVRDEYKLCPFCGTDIRTGTGPPVSRSGDDAFALNGGLVAGGAILTIVYYLCGGMYLEEGNLLFAARHGSGEFGSPVHLLTQRNAYMWIGFLLPILITGLPYLLLRRRFPTFARGLGYVCLVALAVALGAPFLCKQ